MSSVEYSVAMAGDGNYGFTVTLKNEDGSIKDMEVVVSPSPGKAVKKALKRMKPRLVGAEYDSVEKTLMDMLPSWKEKHMSLRGQMRAGRASTWQAEKTVGNNASLEKTFLQNQIIVDAVEVKE